MSLESGYPCEYTLECSSTLTLAPEPVPAPEEKKKKSLRDIINRYPVL